MAMSSEKIQEILTAHAETERRKRLLREAAEDMAEALRPFAHFVEMLEQQPLRPLGETIYRIHFGTKWEADIKRSDLVRARDVLRKAGVLP